MSKYLYILSGPSLLPEIKIIATTRNLYGEIEYYECTYGGKMCCYYVESDKSEFFFKKLTEILEREQCHISGNFYKCSIDKIEPLIKEITGKSLINMSNYNLHM